MKFALVGYGKMGRAIEREALRRGHERVVAANSAAELHSICWDGIDVAFEFSVPEAAARNVTLLVGAGVGVVCGTTGWSPDAELRRVLARARAGVVLAPNFSLGVRLFFRIVAHAAGLLGRLGLHQPYVLESHHRGKRDIPSGTAIHLGRLIVEADPRMDAVHVGPIGGPPAERQVQIVSLRAGSEPGSHTVGFDAEQDRIVLTHDSRSRQGFALGAVLAAEWLRDRRGLQDFESMVDEWIERGAGDAGGMTR